MGEHLEIGSDNGKKGSKTGEQWKYELAWDPRDWWQRSKLRFWEEKEEQRSHSAESLPLQIPTGDLVKLTLLYVHHRRARCQQVECGTVRTFKWTPESQLIRGQHF